MKRWFVTIGLLILAISLIVSCSGGPSPTPTQSVQPTITTQAATSTPTATAPAKVYNWKFQSAYKSTDVRGAWWLKWISEVDKRSGGRIKMTYYDVDTLVKMADLPDAMKSGIVEVGVTVPSYYAGKLPLTAVIEYFPTMKPIEFNESPELWVLMREENAKQINAYQIFGGISDGNGWFSREPFPSPESLNGKLVRSSGGVVDDVIAAYGGKPVTMPTAEIYTAAQRGTVDMVTQAVNSWNSFKLYEVLPHVLTTDMWPFLAVYGSMNLDIWNGLPTDLQQIMEKTGWELLQPFYKEIAISAQKILDDHAAKGTIKIYPAPAGIKEIWLNKAMPAMEKRLLAAPKGDQALAIIKQKYLK